MLNYIAYYGLIENSSNGIARGYTHEYKFKAENLRNALEKSRAYARKTIKDSKSSPNYYITFNLERLVELKEVYVSEDLHKARKRALEL